MLNQASGLDMRISTNNQEHWHSLQQQATYAGTFRISEPQLWSLEQPTLHNLNVQLYNKDGVLVDEYDLSYGIREIRLQNGQLLLNGQAIFLKGFGKHEDIDTLGKGLSMGTIVRDFGLLKWVGANSVRTSHYPYAEEFLDYADRNGILVIAETPLVGLCERLYRPDVLERSLQIIDQMVKRDQNHPSVIAWSLANEPRIDSENGRAFFKAMYDYTKELDSSRPIMFVANLQPANNKGMEYYDLVGLNRYHGWYEMPGQLDIAIATLSHTLDEFHNAFAKPIIVTEFGADALAGQHSIVPVMFSEEYQAEFIAGYYKTICAKSYCIGSHIWAFADFRTAQHTTRIINNNKGVFTRERQPKLAAHLLRQLWHNT
jgi:beta-glucuronidase